MLGEPRIGLIHCVVVNLSHDGVMRANENYMVALDEMPFNQD